MRCEELCAKKKQCISEIVQIEFVDTKNCEILEGKRTNLLKKVNNIKIYYKYVLFAEMCL